MAARCTSASGSLVSKVARTIPLAPFLEGRGKKRKVVYGGTSSIPPARGGAPPLDSRYEDRGSTKKGWGAPPYPCQRGGALWTPAFSMRTCYAFPFAPPRHCECSEAIWGGGGALYSRSGECGLSSGSDHPPSPLPRRKGEEKKSSLWRHILHTACPRGRAPSGLPLQHQYVLIWLWGTPPDPCQWAAPSGLPL